MKKKLIFAVAIGFFAVATVLNLNLIQSNNADDVSLDAIAIMAQAGNEAGAWTGRVASATDPFHRGLPLTNWEYWLVDCWLTTTTTSNTNVQSNRTTAVDVSFPVPKTPGTANVSFSSQTQSQSSSGSSTTGAPVHVRRTVCGAGRGSCPFPAPANPCA